MLERQALGSDLIAEESRHGSTLVSPGDKRASAVQDARHGVKPATNRVPSNQRLHVP